MRVEGLGGTYILRLVSLSQCLESRIGMRRPINPPNGSKFEVRAED